MGAILAKFLVRMITYFLGLIVVLALIAVGAFVIARPQIDEFVTSEIRKRGLEVEGWDFSLNGRANLRNAQITLPDGIELKATLISARPPIAGFPGAATLYDVHLQKGNISLSIPELDISGLVQHEKDNSIHHQILQILYRFDIAQVRADVVNLEITMHNGSDTATVHDFVLDHVARGKVDRLAIGQIESQLNPAAEQANHGIFHAGSLELRNLDIEAALIYLTHQTANGTPVPVRDVQQMIGQVHFRDIAFDGEIAAKPVQLRLGSLTSQGFSLVSSDLVPLDVIKTLIESSHEGDLSHEQILEKLLPLLSDFKGMDAILGEVNLAVPTATVSLQSLNLHANDWEDFMPERIAFSMDGLILHITNPPEEIAQVLSTTGYNKIEMSAAMQAGWDRNLQRLNLENLSLTAKDIGEFSVTFQLDSVDMLPLVRGEEDSGVWLKKLRLHDFDLRARDQGAVANFVTIIATIGGVDPEEIQQGIEDMARGTPEILFQDEALAADATQALLAFLQKSGLFRLHITAREEAGLAFEQIMGDEIDWQSILAITDIRFTHEDAAAGPL